MSEETKTTETTLSQVPEFEYVEPEDGIFRTYTNHHRFGSTDYDIRLLFGELLNVEEGKIIIEETAQVTMSWKQAKELLGTLQDLIAKHEAPNESESSLGR